MPGAQDNYWNLLELHNKNRIDYNDRKWETIKFCHGAFSVLTTASLAAAVTAREHTLLPLLFISALLILGVLTATLGARNLRRESKLLFVEEYQMFKLAHLLDLDQEIAESQRWLPGDRYLLPSKWREWKHNLPKKYIDGPFDSIEQLADTRTSTHRFADFFDLMFAIETALALTLLVAIWIVW
jgi:hypothetical protein